MVWCGSHRIDMDTSTVLLNRLLLAKESGFYLLVDLLAQSSHYLVGEFVRNVPALTTVIAVTFEAVRHPSWAAHWIDAMGKLVDEVVNQLGEVNTKRLLVVIDSLNYIANTDLTQFIQQIMLPNVTVVAGFHNREMPRDLNYPDLLTLLSFVAQAIFEVYPAQSEDEEIQNRLAMLQLAKGLNRALFRLELTHRRKLGRLTTYLFTMDANSHVYTPRKVEKDTEDDEAMLADLTTFNLGTSSKQRAARDQVELPYLQAQSNLGSLGGAIVYEYEKDDDYDEEDPYEDPF